MLHLCYGGHMPKKKKSSKAGVNEGESDRIRKALSFAREHLAEDLPAQRLADVACLSLRLRGRLL